MSRVAAVIHTFFDGVADALLVAYAEVLSRLLSLNFMFVSVLLVFDFYPIKVLRHVVLPPIPSLLLLGLASRILVLEVLEGYPFELLCLL